MIDPKIQQEFLTTLDNLPEEAQQELAAFAQMLSRRQHPASAANALLKLGGSIDREDLKQIEKAIEEDCEKVDEHFEDVAGLQLECW